MLWRCRWTLRWLAWFAVFASSSLALAQQARTLYWEVIDVHAFLDADGRLQITETQTFVFDGDWNGGERRFRVEPGQKLEFASLRQIDPVRGRGTPWSVGPLTQVGEYRWFGDTLRWRSRLSTDAPFRYDLRVYELRYALSGVLVPDGGSFVLDHDFAFSDRPGVIRKFSSTLTLDPVWRPTQAFEPRLERTDLPPGEGAVQRVVLQYVGEGQPRAVASRLAALHQPAGPGQTLMLVALVLVVLAGLGASFAKRERASGHLHALYPIEQIDEAWLAEHLFKFPPELVGAAWDRRTSAHEVAAVLARMALEGKLASQLKPGSGRAGKEVLYLELRCDRESLDAYERSLVDALFFDGPTTDSERIQKHYRKQGFDPVALIKPALSEQAKPLFGEPRRLPFYRGLLTFVGAFAGAMLLGSAASRRPEIVDPGIGAVVLLLLGYMAARHQAAHYRDTVLAMRARGLVVGVALLWLLAVVPLASLAFPVPLTRLGLIGVALLTCAALWSVFNAICPRESPDTLRARKLLASARRFFSEQLKATQPRLRDEWFPYLLGFGLGPDVAQWLRVHAATTRMQPWTSSPSGSSSASASGPSWTGGGGVFGGAGASGSWATAVGTIAQGVARPSSGSGGSSGGGSGGSSGGGGGGGW